ncbi:MAG: DUF4111 domain-containing protein [Candidatus Eremiobacteraeota bacterium]|nr:DUF4111 domain-containing protein [Candidatus Eremiobacteraeota bacterium]
MAILGADVRGIYLTGSLAAGCFNPLRSDIDLLILSAEASAQQLQCLAELTLVSSLQPCPLEISVLAPMDNWHYPPAFALHYSESWRERITATLVEAQPHFGGTNPDLAIDIICARERGICLTGAPAAGALPCVPSDDLEDALRLEVGWAAERKDIDEVYFVLNGVRAHCALRHGMWMSKDEAGSWALAHLPAQFHETVSEALNVYRGHRNDGRFNPETLEELRCYLVGE